MKKNKSESAHADVVTDDDDPESSGAASEPAAGFPVVGVGASAGGLDAFTQLLHELPSDTGMAFVLIQHLDSTHPSLLATALAKSTRMPVAEITGGERVEADHVYVIPPGADVALQDGRLVLTEREPEGSGLHLPIDFFLRSLAADCGARGIGVILSGTASDGTEGLRAIKSNNGITFAQEPKSAKFDGMPQSAVDALVVDYCLAIPLIARELVRLSQHPYVFAKPLGAPPAQQAMLFEVFESVRRAVGVDFGEYKWPTVERRLARRMALRRCVDLYEYLEILRTDEQEPHELFEDILIHVSSFFRDPEVFEILKTQGLPKALARKPKGAPIRVWVAGCSLGEEVYSIAILLLELLGSSSNVHPIQIFGSDVSERAIERARRGVFPESALADVSEERRRRYFTRVDAGYRIHKSVRDLCVFVRHDLARDPPFSKLDLVSCRNVLIYFGSAMQKRVLPMLHYALNEEGLLLLGRTESITGFHKLFTPEDKANKLFLRTGPASALRFAPRTEAHASVPRVVMRVAGEQVRRPVDVTRHLERLLVSRYAPPGVLINEKMMILQFLGDTGNYLRPAPGEPQSNLLKMVRTGSAPLIRAVVAQAKKAMAPTRREGVELDQLGAATCDLVVMPLAGAPGADETLYLVLFEKGQHALNESTPAALAPTTKGKRSVRANPKIEHELAETKQYLQSLLDDQDRANEDLNAVNEELVSSNEELQSMNEELETAKEELQSTNEELTTVNDELHSRNLEVSEINSDLVNILATVNVPILILDRDRRIRRFTPKARSILNVLASDVGRPLDDIKLNLDLTDLDARIAEVIETNTVHESEIQDRKGTWYRMQIRPYKTIDNKIDGATLSLFDIDALKHHVSEADAARAEAERANRAKDEFLATLSHEIRTPLSSILMQAQMLRRSSADANKVLHAAEVIERGTRLQVQLIDDLLDISRIVTNKLRIEMEDVDLVSIIAGSIETMTSSAERKGVHIELAPSAFSELVVGDKTRLVQVVTNLLANAIKFTPKDGHIFVVLEVVNGTARVQVRDTGMGIEPEFLPHVFNRFAQEDASIIRRHGGLGLGLAIVHSLIEAHGGSVLAESEGRGKGSTFTVFLPLSRSRRREQGPTARDGDTSRDADSPARPEHARLRDVRVVVVDDDASMRDTLAEFLGQDGASVKVAASAAEGLEAARTFRPDVILSDIAMPGEDGYAFIRRIRALGPAEGGNTPALAVTALAGEENRQRALAAGYQMHMSKPVELESLLRAVVDLAAHTVRA